GNFSNGAFNGYGVTTIINDGETLEMSGTYTNGEFTPTTGESFNYIGQLDLFGKFTISDAVIEYIDENENLFPTATNEAIQSSDIQDFSSKQFNKTRKQDQIGLVKLDLYAVQVFEDDYLGGKLTYLWPLMTITTIMLCTIWTAQRFTMKIHLQPTPFHVQLLRLIT
ncbi:MAG: hypothetical protein ACLUE5_04805, partial [Dysosmobacter sp.]